MVTRDKRVDTYIEKAPEYARPILAHLRAVIHSACPDVVETVKWGKPSFDYKGILCGMAYFKQHCAFGFWKHDLVVDGAKGKELEAMGSFGRLTSVADLPPKATLARYVKKAMKLNDEGVKVVRAKTVPKKAVPVHPAFKAALDRNPKASKALEAFSPSHRREYVEWIAQAKGEDTRERRITSAIEWLNEGKSRNWKYEKC
jgi:uncharacterized protein YdeI (YjbR/CyaY-like superfamily)